MSDKKIERPYFGLEDNNKEVAEALGITEQGATFIKKNALKKAKIILEEKGFKVSDFFGGEK
jgi:DNA-directed RNA polymerase specialized sigma subunit